MARIQKKTVLLAVLAMACTRSAYGTVELIDAALQAKASELESLKGQGSGSTSTTTQIGYGQGSSVTSGGWQPPPTGAACLASWPQCILAALPGTIMSCFVNIIKESTGWLLHSIDAQFSRSRVIAVP